MLFEAAIGDTSVANNESSTALPTLDSAVKSRNTTTPDQTFGTRIKQWNVQQICDEKVDTLTGNGCNITTIITALES